MWRGNEYGEGKDGWFFALWDRILIKLNKDSDLKDFTDGELALIFNSRLRSGLLFVPWRGKRGILVIIEDELKNRNVIRSPYRSEFPAHWLKDLDEIRKEKTDVENIKN